MNTQTFLIRCEYPDGDHIPTQEFVENIQEYFAANIMDGERGRLVVKPVYQPKRDSLYQECLDAVPESIKERVGIEVEFSNFVSLVRRMREAQKDVIYKSMFSALDSARPTAYEVAKTKQIVLEQEADEHLKKMEDLKIKHFEFKGSLGEFLSKIDEYFGLKDLSAEVKAVIDIKDKKDEDVQE